MSVESPTLFIEPQSAVENEFGNEWEPIVPENESAEHELPHDESAQEAFLSPVYADLLLYKGGFPEDWERVDRGEGFTLDSGAVRNNETGEAWQGFSEDDIEQLQENGFVRLDTVVVDGKEIATYLIRGHGNSVHYEMYAADIRESVDDIDLNYDRYEPVVEDDTSFIFGEESDASDIPEAIPAPEILSLASAHVEEETEQGAQQEIIAETREEVVVPPETRAEEFSAEQMPERDHSHAAVIQSLENLAVYHFEEDEMDIPVIASVAEQAPTVEIVRPHVITEKPVAREFDIPVTLAEQETPMISETTEPEKRAETSAEPARVTAEIPVTSMPETAPASPALETLAAAPDAPDISVEAVHIQEAVQQLLAEPSLDAFFEEDSDETTPAITAPVPRLPDISTAAEETTTIEQRAAIHAPAIEVPRGSIETIVSEPVVQTQIETPLIRTSAEMYTPAPEMTVAMLERVANDNELATERFALVETKEAKQAAESDEPFEARTRSLATLTEDDLLPVSARPTNNPPHFTSRNGISIKIAA